MKTKLLFLLTLSMLLFACDNNDFDDTYLSGGDTNGAQLELKFSNTMLAIHTGTRATTLPAEVYERSLDNVQIFVFENDGTAIVGNFVEKYDAVFDTNNNDTENGVAANCNLQNLIPGKYWVVALANNVLSSSDINNITDYTDFSTFIITKFPDKSLSFSMVSNPVEVDIKTDRLLQAKIDLVRHAARIDVVNQSDNTTAPFILTGARIINAVDRSRMVRQTNTLHIGDVVNGNTVTDKALSWTNTTTDEIIAEMYTFENDYTETNSDPTPTHIEIRGTYNGIPVQHTVPFGDKKIQRNHRYLVTLNQVDEKAVVADITVTDWVPGEDVELVPYTATPVITKIESRSTSWGTTTTSLAVNERFKWYEEGNPTAQGLSSVSSSVGTGNTLSAVITNNDISKIYFPFWRYRTRFTILCNTDIDVIVEGDPGVAIIQTGAGHNHEKKQIKTADNKYMYEQYFDIEFNANSLPKETDRFAKLKFVNKIDNTLLKEIEIVQHYLPNPLLRFAKGNLKDVGVIGDPITELNVQNSDSWGSLWQWGRNVPFPATGTLPSASITNLSGTAIPFNDPQSYSNNFLNSTLASVWGNQALPVVNANNNAAFTTNLWAEAVKLQTTTEPYYNSDGDPSPEGYKIADMFDYYAIVAANKSSSNSREQIRWYANSLLSNNNMREGNNNTASWVGTGYEIRLYSEASWENWVKRFNISYYAAAGSNIIYGLKYLNLFENAARTAYKWELVIPTPPEIQYIKITSRHLGETGTEAALYGQEITTAEVLKNISEGAGNFWNSNDENDVIRIFPKVPSRSRTGVLNSSTESTAYWVSFTKYAGMNWLGTPSGNIGSNMLRLYKGIGQSTDTTDPASYYISPEWSTNATTAFPLRSVYTERDAYDKLK